MSNSSEMLGVPRLPQAARGPLSAQTREKCEMLMKRYPEPVSALLPMLYLVQAEHGCVSREGVREIARMLDLTPAEVTAVATFYTMFKREKCGEYLVSVCTQPPCALRGANQIKAALEQELGLKCGQTLEDGTITLEEVECLCICDGAPIVAINYEHYEGRTPEQIVEIVRGLRNGVAPPKPARGDVPKPSSEIHQELSGLNGVIDAAH